MARLSPGRFVRFALVAPALLLAAPGAQAGVGDLLVAPTRIVLDGRRGTEIILKNIGDDVATYRVSVEFRRMGEDGKLTDVELPNDKEKAAEEMILYAPRKVVLPPDQPQASSIQCSVLSLMRLCARTALRLSTPKATNVTTDATA